MYKLLVPEDVIPGDEELAASYNQNAEERCARLGCFTA
jgi:hypothetical protein